MIGGKGSDDGIASAFDGEGRGRGDRWAGIASQRLQHDIGLSANGGELLSHQKPVLHVGDDDRPTKRSRISEPAHRVLKRRIRTKQRQELLGPSFTRGRP